MQVVWRLPTRSQEFDQGPVVRQTAGGVTIFYDYELDVGGYAWNALEFDRIAAYRFTAADACTVDQVKAYDRLEEVNDSPWIAELLVENRPPRVPDARHFRIYFDEIGCFEVAAARFEPRINENPDFAPVKDWPGY